MIETLKQKDVEKQAADLRVETEAELADLRFGRSLKVSRERPVSRCFCNSLPRNARSAAWKRITCEYESVFFIWEMEMNMFQANGLVPVFLWL